MPDIEQPATLESPAAGTAAPAAPTPETPVETLQTTDTPAPDWRTALETADPEELRKHPRISGLAGELAHRIATRQRQEWEADQQARAQADATQAERERLRKLRRDDPIAYAEEMETYDTREETQRYFESMQVKTRETTRDEFSGHIGRAFHDVPEWRELGPDDFNTLAQAVAGKADHEALAAFNAKALDLVAERRAEARAQARFSQWKTRELDREREAIRREVSAEVLQKTGGPNLTAGKPVAKFDPAKLADAEFTTWYEKNMLGR